MARGNAPSARATPAPPPPLPATGAYTKSDINMRDIDKTPRCAGPGEEVVIFMAKALNDDFISRGKMSRLIVGRGGDGLIIAAGAPSGGRRLLYAYAS
ncbi:hypothetical protein EVAR_12885_1 [Eumeta japonica]|uniref:Uncharacterized protein n=1 Tax=Eumeta variegata TaxID=151549 RepID=A0A4C1TWS5_EUMVA|nr:hypothetical protein EVAR_12885_1 [Eumeta japonica]